MKPYRLILMMSVLGMMVVGSGQARTVREPGGAQTHAGDDLFEYRLHRHLDKARKHAATAPTLDRPPTEAPWSISRIGSSPAEVCAAVRRQVRYTHDAGPADQWKPAWQTWDSGRGDCEDMAVVVQHLCGELGIPVDVYRLYPGDGQLGHVIALGRWQGKLWMSSNASYQVVASVDEAVRHAARALKWNPADVEVVVGRGAVAARATWRGLRDAEARGP